MMTLPPLIDWRQLLTQSICSPQQLDYSALSIEHEVDKVVQKYPMRINPYYAGLMQTPLDPIWRQAVPDPAELEDNLGQKDPLAEEQQSAVPNVIHRYPNRVVFLVSNRCAVYCRHCMRKRRVGMDAGIDAATISRGIKYIAKSTNIFDVILSGGDPLLLEDQSLFDIVMQLRTIPHVKIIRIHTRVPCTLPQRITPQLVSGLAQFHPLWLNTQFNHPLEITNQARLACSLLVDAGIPIGCQTVLLRHINDSAEILTELMKKLLQIRVKPYYLHHPDQIEGTRHFWVSPEKGLAIMNRLQGYLPGLAVPRYMIDLPGGGGKVPILPESIVEKKTGLWRIRNYEGKIFEYPFESSE
ncbi:MAG: KamA family radical SAM protein [Desulfobacteraceae bacterium]|jgi:lysine 2,3-aminomutase